MAEQSFETCIAPHFPQFVHHPTSLEEVKALPSFYQDLRALEELQGKAFGALEPELREAFTAARLSQLVDICRLNPSWKERINGAIGDKKITTLDAFRQIPITQKADFIELFGGDRKGLVLPLTEAGFLVAASGGTSSGQPSQIVYTLRELQETYQWAGAFIGQYITGPAFSPDKPRWLGTTLSDSQLWSSGTMVGGVLQNVPDINYLGIGPMSAATFRNIMSYPGDKGLMGIAADIANLLNYAEHLDEAQRRELKVLLYGSGPLTPRVKAQLREAYPEVKVLSFFAATQAETIGLQCDESSMRLSSVPGLHFIEIVKEDGSWAEPGEIGELVITRLFGNGAPILRLNLGDRVHRLSPTEKDGAGSFCFEYISRSGDFMTHNGQHIYFDEVFLNLEQDLLKKGLPSLSHIASDIQFHYHEEMNKLTLLLAVEEPERFETSLTRVLEGGRTMVTEAFPNISVQLNIIHDGSDQLHHTAVGKTPFVYRSH